MGVGVKAGTRTLDGLILVKNALGVTRENSRIRIATIRRLRGRKGPRRVACRKRLGRRLPELYFMAAVQAKENPDQLAASEFCAITLGDRSRFVCAPGGVPGSGILDALYVLSGG